MISITSPVNYKPLTDKEVAVNNEQLLRLWIQSNEPPVQLYDALYTSDAMFPIARLFGGNRAQVINRIYPVNTTHYEGAIGAKLKRFGYAIAPREAK